MTKYNLDSHTLDRGDASQIEKKILDRLRDARPGCVQLWGLVNGMAEEDQLGQSVTESRQVVVSAINRMIKAKKIIRYQTNTIRISETFV